MTVKIRKADDRLSFTKLLKRDKYLLILSIPGIILLIAFHYIPMAGIIMAFERYSFSGGIFGSEWVGLKYFTDFINGPYFLRLIRNTFLLNVYSLIFGFPTPIILALLFNELKVGYYKRISQTISYLPYFIASVIIVGMLKTFFSYDGIVNDLITSLGFQSIEFFAESSWFRPLYVGSGIWQGVGYGSILYLAVLSNIDIQLYEAAIIDGANRWHRNWYINIPSLRPLIVILFILNMGNMLNVGFEKVYLMYNPIIYETADVISTYLYRMGLENRQYSLGAAVGLINSVVNFSLLVSANFICRKVNDSSLW